MYNVELVIDAKAMLGEGPIWDQREECLYWVDITANSLHRFDPETGKNTTIKTDQMIGAAARKAAGGFISAMHHGIYILDEQGKRVETLGDPESHLPNNRFNDGKCDRLGRFWAGTLAMDGSNEAAALYRIDLDGKITKMLDGVTTSNGLAWSPDHTTFYYIDTDTKTVWAFDYEEEEGTISNRRAAAVIPEDDGFPDGMTIDEEGMLWVAHWGGYKVSRIDPQTGKTLQQISIPAKQVTSCCFGGRNLDELYVTSARTGLDDAELQRYPHSGGVFRIKLSVKGSPTYYFKG